MSIATRSERIDGGALMLARQRQAFILDRVREDGAVRVADLVRELGVSDMTVRRDLEILDERGLLEKVHGGATSIAGQRPVRAGVRGQVRAPADARRTRSPTRPSRLAEPGMAIAVSAGTTTYALAQRLAHVPGLTVVTNSIRVADVLHQVGRADQTIILTGGVRTPSEALVGPFAVAALRTVHVDLVFVGVHGMDPRSGFTCPNLLEADTDRALIEAGRRLVVVADHSKWGVIGISSIARLDQADVLVTDAGLDPEARGRSSPSAVRELIVVGSGRRRREPRRGRRCPADADGDAARSLARLAGEPHRRYNPLTDEWVLVSAGRTRRPWLGRRGAGRRTATGSRYDPDCYLCPGNTRANGNVNPDYAETFVFTNDFAALRPDTSIDDVRRRPAPRGGRARVVPGRLLLAAPRPDARRHGARRRSAGSSTSGPSRPPSSAPSYRWVQVFENRGEAMGASNPHPHGQIWAGTALPGRAPARTRRSARHLARDRPAAAARLRRPGDRAARGSSSRPTSGWPSCRSGRPGRSRRCSSRSGRRRA